MSEIDRLETIVKEQGQETRLVLLTQAESVTELATQVGKLSENIARHDERILNIIDNNNHIERKVSILQDSYNTLKNTVGLNRYARDVAPRMFFALCGAVAIGAGTVWAVLKNG